MTGWHIQYILHNRVSMDDCLCQEPLPGNVDKNQPEAATDIFLAVRLRKERGGMASKFKLVWVEFEAPD